MIIIRRVGASLLGITHGAKQGYHMLSLLESKYENEHIKLNPQLFPLYIHRLKNASFSERFLVVLAVDCFRTGQPQEQFRQIVAYALNNLQKFQSRITLVVLLNQVYLYKVGEKETVHKLVTRAFELQENEDTGSSYFNLKLMILISELMGLQSYPQALYRKIDFKKFKPLTIAMVLQLFYQRGLQEKYRLTEELVKMFVACESFIPFADVHHLSYAIRKVTHPEFKECFYRVRRRIQATLSRNEGKQEENGFQKTQEMKGQPGSGKWKEQIGKGQTSIAVANASQDDILSQTQDRWTTDEQLLTIFRKNIEDKYRKVE